MNELVRQAANAYKRGDYRQAIELLRGLDNATDEDNGFASLYLGMSYVKAPETTPILHEISMSSRNESMRKAATALLSWYKSTEKAKASDPNYRWQDKGTSW